MATLFTSDTHFWHRNVIGFCNRPNSKYFHGDKFKDQNFKTVEEMNEYLISRWNERVRPEDMVYHLGDFSFGPKKNVPELRKLLNGQICIIKGNHDRKLEFFRESGFEARHQLETVIDGVKVFMAHHPPEDWPGKIVNGVRRYEPTGPELGYIYLHGHVHELCRRWGDCINVGCDVWNYQPVTLQELLSVGQDANPITGHRRCRRDPWDGSMECSDCRGYYNPTEFHKEAPEVM